MDKTIQDLCRIIDRTDLANTFDLLMSKIDFFGVEPALTYVKHYAQVMEIRLQWAFETGQPGEQKQCIEQILCDCHTILKDLVEECCYRVKPFEKSKEVPPQSVFYGV